MPPPRDLASPADDPVRAPAATARCSAIACSPRPRDRMGPYRRARLQQELRPVSVALRAGHGTNVELAQRSEAAWAQEFAWKLPNYLRRMAVGRSTTSDFQPASRRHHGLSVSRSARPRHSSRSRLDVFVQGPTQLVVAGPDFAEEAPEWLRWRRRLSASLAARSLAAIVPGAGSWRNEEHLGRRQSLVNSVNMPPSPVRWRATWVWLPARPGFFLPRYEASETVIATRPMGAAVGLDIRSLERNVRKAPWLAEPLSMKPLRCGIIIPHRRRKQA